jgi:GT2 family glycosyltransferase
MLQSSVPQGNPQRFMHDFDSPLVLTFGRYGNGHEYCRQGWREPELTHTWTSGLYSRIELPRPKKPGRYVLQFDIAPPLGVPGAAPQKLSVSINAAEIGSFDVRTRASIQCPIDWKLIKRAPAVQVEFRQARSEPSDDRYDGHDEVSAAFGFASLILYRVDGIGSAPRLDRLEEPASAGPPALPPDRFESANSRAADSADSLRIFGVKTLGDLIYDHRNGERAEICVVIPLYNYERYIEECLESVGHQDIENLSVIVINDRSSDDGEELAVKFLESHIDRFQSARVVRHRRNQGLAMARNSGIAWSREPFLFMLDADNRLRVPALSRLLEALVISGREFAYSQIQMFGEFSAIGSADIWDPKRFRHYNYIDGMALIKRSVLLATGGYRVSAVQDGWEDFDLWCQFAELGYQGTYLPEFLCEYRVHSSSMVHTRTNFQRRSLSLEMVLRHPTLFAGDDLPPLVNFFPPDSN